MHALDSKGSGTSAADVRAAKGCFHACCRFIVGRRGRGGGEELNLSRQLALFRSVKALEHR